jgi:membrane-associated protease RseP (regulator of RpoE activity)
MRYTIRYSMLVTLLSLAAISQGWTAETPAPPKDLDARLSAIESDLRDIKSMLQDDRAMRSRMMNRMMPMERMGRPDVAMRPRGRMGVELAPATPEVAQRFKSDAKEGAFVINVQPGSAAEKAGLRPGDLATSFRGSAIKSPDDLVSGVKSAPAGKSDLNIVRDGKPMVISIELSAAMNEAQDTHAIHGDSTKKAPEAEAR